MGGLTRGEWVRQLGHGAFGGAVFLWPYGGVLLWGGLCAAALLFNLLALPQMGGDRLLRRGRRNDGIWLYPLAMLVVVLVFRDRPLVIGAVWLTVAVGDAAATVVGLTAGGASLPWNRDKSWNGLLAFVLFGSVAVGLFLFCFVEGANRALWWTAIAGVSLAAWVESLPLLFDDNLSVPIAASLVFSQRLGDERAIHCFETGAGAVFTAATTMW